MDENFNNEQMNYDQNETVDVQYVNQDSEHLHENVQKAKTAFDLGLISLLGSLGSIFVYFVLSRMIFVMVVLPLLSVGGIIIGIKAIISDKGLPKAYIGLALSILGLLPSLLCTLLFVLEIFARF